jgi:outer membrane protein assembly factor BamE (lipoprotein component of BamABCDE complex)
VRTLLVLCVVAGCAVSQPSPKPAPLGPGEIPSAHAADDVLTVGSTTKADVRAALGEATVVDFTSGYEVWVYRQRATEKPPAPGAELVLLFEPSGMLAKTRVR